jgi:hypothetical protein
VLISIFIQEIGVVEEMSSLRHLQVFFKINKDIKYLKGEFAVEASSFCGSYYLILFFQELSSPTTLNVTASKSSLFNNKFLNFQGPRANQLLPGVPVTRTSIYQLPYSYYFDVPTDCYNAILTVTTTPSQTPVYLRIGRYCNPNPSCSLLLSNQLTIYDPNFSQVMECLPKVSFFFNLNKNRENIGLRDCRIRIITPYQSLLLLANVYLIRENVILMELAIVPIHLLENAAN